MDAHVPTLFLIIIVTSAALAVAIAGAAWRRHSELFIWSAGLGLHTLAYAMFALRGQISDAVSIIVGNIALAATLALFNEGLFRFQRRPVPRALVWLPVFFVAVAFPLLLSDMGPRLVVGSAIFSAQCATMIVALWQRRRTTPGRGQYILGAGSFLVVLIFLLRIGGVLSGQSVVTTIATANPLQTVTFIAAVIGLILLTVGILLMTWERAEAATAGSERMYRTLTESMKDVVWTLDAETLRFSYVSPSVMALRGYTPEEVMAEPMDAALTPEGAQAIRALVGQRAESLRRGEIGSRTYFTNEVAQPRKDGSTVWTEVITRYGRNEDSGRIEVHGVTRDISERKNAEERILHMAQHDALTGLPNRALFDDRATAALAAARRDGQRLALLFIDIDRFKPINDRHGHAIGDCVLQQLAERIRQAIRESDTAARIGGDEFVVLLRNVQGREDALRVAEKIRLGIDAPLSVAATALQVSASIGVALFPDHGGDLLELSQHADQAMYRAKETGRDTVAVYAGAAQPATA